MNVYLPEAGRHAVDERCTCGHPRSEHDDQIVCYRGLAVSVPGRGRCCEAGCSCRRFKWAAWVLSAKVRKTARQGRGAKRRLTRYTCRN
jgi:hypothetical protein